MNRTDDTQVEVVLFAGSQGNFLGGSIASILRAVTYAESRGLKVALTAMLQAPTELTQKVARQFLDARWQVVDVPTPTLDHARNAARSGLRGQFAAFIDGDDLWCETWLHAAYHAASATSAVWRPEALLTFGNDYHRNPGYSAIFQPLHVSNPAPLLLTNPLPSGFVASRDILMEHAWPTMDSDRRWRDVDQGWNCDVAAGGIEHRALAATFHYRRIRNALLWSHNETPLAGDYRIGPTRLATMQAPHVAGGHGRYMNALSSEEYPE